MTFHFSTALQYLAPQRVLTRLMGWLAECRVPWFKNWFISRFINRYQVNLNEAIQEEITDYPNFNQFFTRKLKPHLRPIARDEKQLVCPADGFISQIGNIHHETLFQAKGFYFDLTSLLGGDIPTAKLFRNGLFATLYLSPRDYHRVHMPLSGQLRKTIYIPGKLFSVNRRTTHQVPRLFSRNERLVCLFDTEFGPMAVIMVAAMLVGNINVAWQTPIISDTIQTRDYPEDAIQLTRGDEMGFFQMGSTVILLFAEHALRWADELRPDRDIRMGQAIAELSAEMKKGQSITTVPLM